MTWHTWHHINNILHQSHYNTLHFTLHHITLHFISYDTTPHHITPNYNTLYYILHDITLHCITPNDDETYLLWHLHRNRRYISHNGLLLYCADNFGTPPWLDHTRLNVHYIRISYKMESQSGWPDTDYIAVQQYWPYMSIVRWSSHITGCWNQLGHNCKLGNEHQTLKHIQRFKCRLPC